jgi:hypothetical protein
MLKISSCHFEFKFNHFRVIILIVGLNLALACHRHVTADRVFDDAVYHAPSNCKALARHSIVSHTFYMYRKYLPKGSVKLHQSIENVVTVDSVDTKAVAVRMTNLGCIVMMLFFIFTLCVVVIGSFSITVQYNFSGLIGLLLQDANVVDYGIIVYGDKLPAINGGIGAVGVSVNQASYYLMAFAFTAFLLVVYPILFFVPLSYPQFRRLAIYAESLQSYSMFEIWVLSLLASYSDLPSFVAAVIGDTCDGINVILEKYFDAILNGDDVCYNVTAKLTSVSCWMLRWSYINTKTYYHYILYSYFSLASSISPIFIVCSMLGC